MRKEAQDRNVLLLPCTLYKEQQKFMMTKWALAVTEQL